MMLTISKPAQEVIAKKRSKSKKNLFRLETSYLEDEPEIVHSLSVSTQTVPPAVSMTTQTEQSDAKKLVI